MTASLKLLTGEITLQLHQLFRHGPTSGFRGAATVVEVAALTVFAGIRPNGEPGWVFVLGKSLCTLPGLGTPETLLKLLDPPGSCLYHYTGLSMVVEHILPSGRMIMNPFSKMRDPRESKALNPVGAVDPPGSATL